MFIHIYSNVALYYRIPAIELKRKYTFTQVKEMFIDIVYMNKNKAK